MSSVLWLKAKKEEAACKRHLTHKPFEEGHFFGETLDKIKEVTGGKVLLPQQKIQKPLLTSLYLLKTQNN